MTARMFGLNNWKEGLSIKWQKTLDKVSWRVSALSPTYQQAFGYLNHSKAKESELETEIWEWIKVIELNEKRRVQK